MIIGRLNMAMIGRLRRFASLRRARTLARSDSPIRPPIIYMIHSMFRIIPYPPDPIRRTGLHELLWLCREQVFLKFIMLGEFELVASLNNVVGVEIPFLAIEVAYLAA